MTYGLPWSETFVRQLEDKEIRDEFVSDQVRLRIAGLVRALREQSGREWSQTELGKRMGKPQNVVSRLEDPDYGKMSLSTLLEVAAAFDLPLWVDMPEWEDWLRQIKDVPSSKTCRHSFDPGRLTSQVHEVPPGVQRGGITLSLAQKEAPAPEANMADEKPGGLATPLPGIVWTRSDEYRIIPCNTFRYRIGLGEATLIFGTLTDRAGDPLANVGEEKVAISVTWSQLKALAYALKLTVDTVEERMGPIPMFQNAGFDISIRDHVAQSLGSMKITKESI